MAKFDFEIKYVTDTCLINVYEWCVAQILTEDNQFWIWKLGVLSWGFSASKMKDLSYPFITTWNLQQESSFDMPKW